MTTAQIESAAVRETPLFSSAHAALTFAHNHSCQVYDKPAMAKLAGKPSGPGKGLGGVDGAAQAGMILRVVQDLPRLHRSILFARFAPQAGKCPTCHGHVDDLDWLGAIHEISDAAVTGALSSHLTSRKVRDCIIERYFGKKTLLAKAAQDAGVSEATVSSHNSKIVSWLRGSRTTKGSEGARGDGTKGQEQLAMEAITNLLSGKGLFD